MHKPKIAIKAGRQWTASGSFDGFSVVPSDFWRSRISSGTVAAWWDLLLLSCRKVGSHASQHCLWNVVESRTNRVRLCHLGKKTMAQDTSRASGSDTTQSFPSANQQPRLEEELESVIAAHALDAGSEPAERIVELSPSNRYGKVCFAVFLFPYYS